MSDISDFLERVGLVHLADTFVAEDIDLSVLPTLDKDDLKELGLTIGQRKKILAALEKLGAPEEPDVPEEEVPVQLRRLSVLFCDLVGSTAMGEKFTIDEMQILLQHYYEAAHDVAQEFDGHVYGTQGDGVIILFGYPKVLEGFAERCLLAAKLLQDQMATAEIVLDGHAPVNLSTRIGIATGQAAVGQGDQALIGETHQLVGPVVNRASRFQTVAQTQSIAVDQKTQELTRGVARYSDPEVYDLKGLPKNTQVFHLQGLRASDDGPAHPVQIVGRDTERDILSSALRDAQAGACATATILGDAGIGKTALVESFLSDGGGAEHRLVRLTCTSMGAQSPLHPIVRHVERERQLDGKNAPTKEFGPETLDKLTNFFGLSSNGKKAKPVSKSDRKEILGALSQWLVSGNDRPGPTIVVVENAQWVDDTTRQLLVHTVENGRDAGVGILIVEITREAGPTIWAETQGNKTIAVGPLDDTDAERLMLLASGGKTIPLSIHNNILKHSAGNPLMLETLGKAQAKANQTQLTDTVEVPHTIYESVSMRLDQIRSGRSIVEMLAVMDSPVSSDMLAALFGEDIAKTLPIVEALKDVGLVSVEPGSKSDLISIRHQVYRDVIYEQITGQSRQKMHAAAYRTLIDFEPDIDVTRPGVLAHHANAARAWDETSIHAANAGEALLAQSALIEASHFLDIADNALTRVQVDNVSNKRRLRVTTNMASVERSRFGISTDNSAILGKRAVELARELGDSKTELLALNGLYAHALVGADYPLAEEHAYALLETAERSQDKTYVMIGTRAIGAVVFHRGEFAKAVEKLTFAIDQYDEEQHLPLTHAFGYDHAEICAAFLSMSYWMMGDLANSRGYGAFSIEHSRKIDHAHSLAQAMAFRVMLGALARDDVELSSIGAEAAELGEKYDIRVMSAAARFFPFATELCLRADAPTDVDLKKLQSLYDEFVAVNPFNYGPLVATLLADVELRAGLLDKARATLEKGIATEGVTGETWTASELMRLSARVLDASKDPKAARKMREEAFKTANQTGAKSIALRIACDMAETDPGLGPIQRVQDALSAMSSADMGWDIQRARGILQTERRA